MIGRELWTTYPQIKLEGQIKRELQVDDPDLALDTVALQERTESFIEDLESSTMFIFCKNNYPGLGLQTKMQPQWVADPTSSIPPVTDAAIFPAVAGVAPRSGTHYKVVVKLVDMSMPRFADSCGYPHWIPGGRTKPLVEDAYELGFIEAVSGTVELASVCVPIERFKRKI